MPTQPATDNVPQMVVDALQDTGFRWTFKASYSLDQLADENRVQVRIDRNVAPKDQVERYAAAMRAGAQFGPIVVTRDGFRVDGNTRIAACLKMARHDFPAVVVDANYFHADTDVTNRLILLGGILNQHNGLPLSRDEVRREVDAAIQIGWTNDAIARHLGVKPGTISGARRELTAQARLADTGLSGMTFDPATLRAIGEHVAIHDEPFREMIKLAHDAGLKATDLRNLARRVEASSSDSLALELLEQERDGLTEQIGRVATLGRTHRAPAQRVRMALGQFLRPEWMASPSLLVDRRPDSDYLKVLTEARDFLDQVIALQEESV